MDAISSPTDALPSFDVLFGPAYKGIPFAATTAVALHPSVLLMTERKLKITVKEERSWAFQLKASGS